jgi:hypothetical protein
MIRKLITPVFLGTVFAMTTLPAIAEDLYHREAMDRNLAGKEVKFRFEETEHGEFVSSAKLTVLWGAASGPAEMMVVRAGYDMAIGRKSSHFIKLSETKLPNGIWLYRFGFTNDPKVEPGAYFKMEQPVPKDDAHAFVAVKDLEMLFKER